MSAAPPRRSDRRATLVPARWAIGLAAVLCLAGGSTAVAQNGPLGRLLNDLFGSGEQSPRQLDLVDRHAAAAPREIARSLEQCDRQIANRQWAVAIQQLQYILELPEDALIQQGAGWLSVKRDAEKKLLSLPEEGRRAYLNQYGQAAADELAKARLQGDFDALCRVASRFRMTDAGQAAADEAASLLADSGDLVTAARWYGELERDQAGLTAAPEWKARAAAVFQMLGHVEAARRLDPRAPSAASSSERNPALPQTPDTAWTEIYGGPARLNSVAGDRPLLLEEWSSLSSGLPAVQEDIEQRQEDLFAGGHRPIPVANVVAAHGLMAVRTVAGVEARQAATGRLLWKTGRQAGKAGAEAGTAESLLARLTTDPNVGGLAPGPGDNHEGHPLASHFYRDTVLGQLSTDGKRLFAISRKRVLPASAFDLFSSVHDQRAEEDGFNSIVALDFQTGRTLWSTGGSLSDAPFEAPLAGVYFFGPPAVDGNELFVIGVAGADVHLYCLESSTGLPKWTQLIAQYDAPRIEFDSVRQMWSCTPLVTRGTIYCPTNAGWLVAVDRLRQRLAWAARYAAGEISDRYQPQFSLSSLNERWAWTAPILSGGELVFAPPELPDEPMQTEPHLYRVDAVTGRIAFRRGKADSIAVGGVYGRTVVVLGPRQLEGWPPIESWSERWSTPYPEGLTPCGIGVAVNGVYWLPFREGAVVGFRLSDGTIEDVLKNESLAGRLGNLILFEGRIISAGPHGIVGLWQKGPFERQLQEQLAKNPADLEARLRKARGLFSTRQWEQALDELASAELLSTVETPLIREARQLQWQCLRSLLQESPAENAARWTQFESLAESPEQKEVVGRMGVDRAMAAGKWAEALDRCWTMAESPAKWITGQGLRVRGDVWLSGRLQRVWNEAPDPVREKLTRRIEQGTKLDDGRLAVHGPQAERLFGFHPLGRRLSLKLGQADAAAGELALAESRLLDLASAPEADTAAAAVVEMAELYRRRDCLRDASRMLRLARQMNPETLLPDGTALSVWIAAQQKKAPGSLRSPVSGWNLDQGSVVRVGAERSFEPGRPIWVHGRSAEWMTEKRFDHVESWLGLVMSDRLRNGTEWSLPLASTLVSYEEWSPEGTAGGSLLATASRGMLHVCSPLDRRLLWSWPIPARFSTPGAYGWAEDQLANQPMRTLTTAVNEFQANLGNPRQGSLMAIAAGRLALLGQRELVVLDVRTGEELWRREGIAPSAVLTADDSTVCVSEMTGGGPAAFQIHDGAALGEGVMEAVFKRAFSVEEGLVLTRQALPRPFSSQARIVAEKPHSGEVVWSQAVSSEVLIHRLPGRELAGVEPTGDLFIIDVETGERTNLGRLPGAPSGPQRELHVLADTERVYVAVQRSRAYGFSHVSAPAISINGDLSAFDRRPARLAWTARLDEELLLTSQFADSPVVLLTEYGMPRRRRNPLDALNLPELKLRVLDKRSGKSIVSWEGVTQHGSPAALRLDPARQRIDLFLNHDLVNFNDRLRLQFGPVFPGEIR